jgi:hypothetical protein
MGILKVFDLVGAGTALAFHDKVSLFFLFNLRFFTICTLGLTLLHLAHLGKQALLLVNCECLLLNDNDFLVVCIVLLSSHVFGSGGHLHHRHLGNLRHGDRLGRLGNRGFKNCFLLFTNKSNLFNCSLIIFSFFLGIWFFWEFSRFAFNGLLSLKNWFLDLFFLLRFGKGINLFDLGKFSSCGVGLTVFLLAVRLILFLRILINDLRINFRNLNLNLFFYLFCSFSFLSVNFLFCSNFCGI